MTREDFMALADAGTLIEFTSVIIENEGYAEAGMQARLTRLVEWNEKESSLRFEVDFTGFDEINAPFESANYFDKHSVPSLTAKQAGYYKPIDTYWASDFEQVEKLFTVVEPAQHALIEAYRDEKSEGETYLSWLTKQAMPLRSAFSGGSMYPREDMTVQESAREALCMFRKTGIDFLLHNDDKTVLVKSGMRMADIMADLRVVSSPVR